MIPLRWVNSSLGGSFQPFSFAKIIATRLRRRQQHGELFCSDSIASNNWKFDTMLEEL